jgi:transcriptional regulator CtsR
MFELECSDNNLHRYHEDNDITSCYKINTKLITFLENKGIYIEKKIGEGGNADVFKVKYNGKDAALLIHSNVEADFDNSEKLEKVKNYPHIFPIVYSYFNVNIPYSTNDDYLSISKDFGNRTIEVIELMDMTLDEFIIKSTMIYKCNIWNKLRNIIHVIENHLIEMYENNILYTDVKMDNLGVMIDENNNIKIKFIDIEGIHLGKSHMSDFNPKNQAHDLIKYEIIPLVESKLRNV